MRHLLWLILVMMQLPACTREPVELALYRKTVEDPADRELLAIMPTPWTPPPCTAGRVIAAGDLEFRVPDLVPMDAEVRLDEIAVLVQWAGGAMIVGRLWPLDQIRDPLENEHHVVGLRLPDDWSPRADRALDELRRDRVQWLRQVYNTVPVPISQAAKMPTEELAAMVVRLRLKRQMPMGTVVIRDVTAGPRHAFVYEIADDEPRYILELTAIQDGVPGVSQVTIYGGDRSLRDVVLACILESIRRTSPEP